ncbi:MAG: helix-turn-helix domain containing protein [Fibrobacterales bacterium]
MNKNKLTKIIIIIAAIAIGSVAVIEGFALFSPNTLPIQSLFGGNQELKKQEERYHTYIDSLNTLDFKIRSETDSKVKLLDQERQKYYRTKIETIRSKLAGESIDTESNTEQSVESLSSTILTALAIPIGILIILIALVIYLIRRKKPEPTLPQDQKPSLAQRFDNAIEQANTKQRPKESISMMLKTLNKSLEEKKAEKSDALKSTQDLPQAVSRDRGDKPRVMASSNTFVETKAVPLVKPPENIVQKETDSGKIEIIAPETPIVPHLVDDESETKEEVFEKEAQINADVIKLARRGYTSSEIARRLRISQDQVDLIIRMQREE